MICYFTLAKISGITGGVDNVIRDYPDSIFMYLNENVGYQYFFRSSFTDLAFMRPFSMVKSEYVLGHGWKGIPIFSVK